MAVSSHIWNVNPKREPIEMRLLSSWPTFDQIQKSACCHSLQNFSQMTYCRTLRLVISSIMLQWIQFIWGIVCVGYSLVYWLLVWSQFHRLHCFCRNLWKLVQIGYSPSDSSWTVLVKCPVIQFNVLSTTRKLCIFCIMVYSHC